MTAIILHRNLHVAGKPVVLQAVIAHDDVAMRVRRKQGHGRGHPVAPRPYRAFRALRKQHGFVANPARIATPGQRLLRGPAPPTVAAIAAQHDAWVLAGSAQPLDRPQNERRLAGAPDSQIAHHDDRYAQPNRLENPISIQGTPQNNRNTETQGDWRQQDRDRTQTIPMAFGKTPASLRARPFKLAVQLNDPTRPALGAGYLAVCSTANAIWP